MSQQEEVMTAKSNLPALTGGAYWEPDTWQMPGTAYVRVLTVNERDDPRFAGCRFVAENQDGEVQVAYGSVGAALISLTRNACQIIWQVDR